MNKNDIKLILIVIIIVSIFLIFHYLNKKQANVAYVYFESEEILKIDLNINDIYEVEGALGNVIIEVKDKKIRVLKETSPYHLCSEKGYISSSGESLICLPNKIIITLPNDSLDTEVG